MKKIMGKTNPWALIKNYLLILFFSIKIIIFYCDASSSKVCAHYSQTTFTQKLALLFSRHTDDKCILNLIHRIQSGSCWGLTSLWAYSLYVSDQPEKSSTFDHRDPALHHRDDYEWFKNVYDMVLKANNATELKNDKNFQRFINHLFFFQLPDLTHVNFLPNDKCILNHSKTMEEIKNNALGHSVIQRPLLDHDIQMVMSKSMLKRRLKIILKDPGKLIFLLGQYAVNRDSLSVGWGHATAMYQTRQSGKVYFYDPNSDCFDVVYDSHVNEDILTEDFWKATALSSAAYYRGDKHNKDDLLSQSDDQLMHVRIQIYSFPNAQDDDKDKKNNYSSNANKEFLENLEAQDMIDYLKIADTHRLIMDYPFMPFKLWFDRLSDMDRQKVMDFVFSNDRQLFKEYSENITQDFIHYLRKLLMQK